MRGSAQERSSRTCTRRTQVPLHVQGLGDAPGVDPAAMYGHFRNREAVLRAALDGFFSMAPAAATAGDAPWTGGPAWSDTSTPGYVFIKYPSIGCDAFATDTFGQGELHEPWLQAVAVASVSGFPLIEEHRHRLLRLDGLNEFSAGLSAILDSAESEGTR